MRVTATLFFFFSSRRRHTRFDCDWSSDVCSSDLFPLQRAEILKPAQVVKVDLAVVLALRSEEHTSELQSQSNLVCRLLLEKKKKNNDNQLRDKHTKDTKRQRSWHTHHCPQLSQVR